MNPAASQNHRVLLAILLLPALLLALAWPEPARAQAKVRLQSAHAGEIKKLLLVYTWSAEMGMLSLADILTALPEAEALILSQFAPGSESFRVFTSGLTRGGLGRNRHGQPRLQFVQDAGAYGPWPRDQALVDTRGTMWVSPSDNHRLRAIFTALDESYGLRPAQAAVAFTGANLIPFDNLVLCPDRLDTLALSGFLQGPFLTLPSPPPPAPFHLDLLVMPLSETVIAVGDDELARSRLLALGVAEQKRIVAHWAVEFAASGHNLEVKAAGNMFRFQTLPRPHLILPALLQEKLQILTELAKPGAFRAAVLAEPEYRWDDRIAAALRRRGFKVVRVPFWPGVAGTVAGKKSGGLPMLCYANSLVWEKGLLMPVYGIASLDQLARDTLAAASGKQVFAVRGGALLGYGNSGPHCLTLEFRQ